MQELGESLKQKDLNRLVDIPLYWFLLYMLFNTPFYAFNKVKNSILTQIILKLFTDR